MKRLSVEERAKAYDERFAKAKEVHDNENDVLILHTIEDIFSELKESEDELTWLKRFIEEEIDCLSVDIRDSEDSVKLKNLQRSIAWLERQSKESKVKPKFREGEWLCENEPNNNARFVQILEIVNVQGKDRYRISRDIHKDEDVVDFGFVEKYYHKFDIQDAKDGDLLSYENEIFIVKKSVNINILYYCCYDREHFIIDSFYSLTIDDIDKIRPATKEQRDLLFKKMHDAGYEWDAENKELRKIEQKSVEQTHAEWSEEDEDMCYKAIAVINRLCAEGKDYVWSIKTLKKLFYWLKSLKDRVGCEADCTTTKEWSEENIEKACEWLENNLQGIVGGSIYIEDFKKAMKGE